MPAFTQAIPNAMTDIELEAAPQYDLSTVVIPLLKGVIYQEGGVGPWNALLKVQARLRDYVAVLGLELMLEEAKGYAFLRSRRAAEDDEDAAPKLPRLVLSRDDIVKLIRVFLPQNSNEVRLIDQIETRINRVVELGFLRGLKTVPGQAATFEVRRILKDFVDAQWLSEFDARLAEYQTQLAGGVGGNECFVRF